jgi:hypothetical protein
MEQRAIWGDLLPVESLIIKRVALEGQSAPVRVTDLLGWKDIHSPASMHRHMKALVKKGWLGFQGDATDQRVKRLVLTQRALEALERAGQTIAQGQQGHSTSTQEPKPPGG